MKRAPIIVSACLVGKRCRYNGEDRAHPGVRRFLRGKNYLAVCPEKLAGWGVPRPPVEFHGGGAGKVAAGGAKIVTDEGVDLTASLMKAVVQAVERAVALGAREAILKEKSPSCGVARVYRDGRLVRGEGVFAHGLKKRGIRARSEESFPAGRTGKK
ncbi:MAG TPA: DUF523 domain-containing protein [Candidatus Binatia bacterium]